MNEVKLNNLHNPFGNTIIEFHILQSFPVTCLNRDDVGAPKTAVVGGNVRARVSSQCWKRQVRLAMRDFGVTMGTRTKLIDRLIYAACINAGATDVQADKCAKKISGIFIKGNDDKKGKKSRKKGEDDEAVAEEEIEDQSGKSNDTLIFLSPKEVKLIAEKLKEKGFDFSELITKEDQKKQAKELADLLDAKIDRLQLTDAADIALFGRMVALAPKMNVEAAASFSHAISTHKVSNEVEFFTALDDLQKDSPDGKYEQGASHLGSLEFNSATYYRYVSLNLGQLYQTLCGVSLSDAVAAFTKALFVAVPGARQATQSGASPWEYAKIFIRKGQRLQVPFETSIRANGGGFLQPSIDALDDYLAKKQQLCGSLFGGQKEYSFGKDENFTIDTLLSELEKYVAENNINNDSSEVNK